MTVDLIHYKTLRNAFKMSTIIVKNAPTRKMFFFNLILIFILILVCYICIKNDDLI
jgi:hypothetical protein